MVGLFLFILRCRTRNIIFKRKSSNMFLHQKELTEKQFQLIFLLWNKVYPVAFHFDHWQYLKNYFISYTDHHHILYMNNKSIEGWWCDFIREDERWFTILVNNDLHKRGIGRSLVELGRKQHKSINGWVIETNELPKIEGDLYQSPMGFYLKMGFEKTKIHVETNSNIKTVKIRWVNK